MFKVFIDGKEGTTGLKIFERISMRNDIELLSIDSHLRKDISERKKLISLSDVTFLCLPDNAAIEAATFVDNENVRIIDASTAHRTDKDWAYGFPELSEDFREKIKNAKRVAVPGCHASGFLALVYPLIKSGILGKDYPITCHSVTGYSGGGKSMIAEYENTDRNKCFDSPRQYALTQNHKHLKEMQYIANLDFAPIFCPIVADFYCGMMVTVPLYSRLLKNISSVSKMREFYQDYYKNQKFIKVMPEEPNMLAANSFIGKNEMHIFIGGNDDRILLSALFDNLGKGASGAAMQCMNIMFGLNEETGLI